MCVHVKDGLSSATSGVEQQPVTLEALVRGDLSRLTQHRGKESWVIDQLADVPVMFARDHQYVCRRLRVDVAKRDGPISFAYDVSRDLPRRDLAEQALVRHARMLRGRSLCTSGSNEHRDARHQDPQQHDEYREEDDQTKADDAGHDRQNT